VGIAAETLFGWQMGEKILDIFRHGPYRPGGRETRAQVRNEDPYFDRGRLPSEAERDAVFHEDPYDLLRASAFLSLHAPETKETHHFLDARAIACLSHGAIVVNTARAGMVVDDDLIAALKSGQVAAAGLDTPVQRRRMAPEILETERSRSLLVTATRLANLDPEVSPFSAKELDLLWAASV
jgi:hypothetical protein